MLWGRVLVGVWGAFLCSLTSMPASATTFLPLITEDAQTLPSRQLDVVVSVQYSRNQRFPNFTPQGAIREQNLLTAPEIELRIGLGGWAEVQASFEMLYLDETLANGDHNRQYGAGDARLFTKIYALSEGDWSPALGAHFGAKLPNASFDDRLGTDETDFAIRVLASRDLGVGSVHANLGLALLGNPGPAIAADESFEPGGQDDLFLWSFAFTSRLWQARQDLGLRALAELEGNAGSRFDNDRGIFRCGAQLQTGGWTAFLGLGAGLFGASEDVSAQAGLMYSFSL